MRQCRKMGSRLASLVLLFAVLLFLPFSQAEKKSETVNIDQQSKRGLVLNIDGGIGPALADYIIRGIKKGNAEQVNVIIIQMDTPGGLDKSMRDMIKHIIASRVPVVSYVAPSGARAASAGTYLSYASHVAAMAPATNLGAATPVNITGGGELPEATPEKDTKNKKDKQAKPTKGKSNSAMTSKVVNDASAYIESLAKLHDRNTDWAVKAVREAASLSAEQALQENVIDLIAVDMKDLLRQIHGRTVKVNGQPQVIDVENIMLDTIAPDWRSQLLSVITDPSVAYILLMLGVYGIFFEFANPGFVLPGVIGAIAIILAMYALQLLPISYAGLGLIILGIAFMIAEALVPSFGILGVGGIIAFVAGSVLLLDTSVPGFGINLWLIGTVALINAGFFVGMMTLAIRGYRQPVVSGPNVLIGQQAIALEVIPPYTIGQIQLGGEIWQAKNSDPKLQIEEGQTVTVMSVSGLLCEVI